MGMGTFIIGLVIGVAIMVAIFLYIPSISMGIIWKVLFTMMGGIVFGAGLDLLVNHNSKEKKG